MAPLHMVFQAILESSSKSTTDRFNSLSLSLRSSSPDSEFMVETTRQSFVAVAVRSEDKNAFVSREVKVTYHCKPFPTAMMTLYICVVLADGDLNTGQLKDVDINSENSCRIVSCSIFCRWICIITSSVLLSSLLLSSLSFPSLLFPSLCLCLWSSLPLSLQVSTMTQPECLSTTRLTSQMKTTSVSTFVPFL